MTDHRTHSRRSDLGEILLGSLSRVTAGVFALLLGASGCSRARPIEPALPSGRPSVLSEIEILQVSWNDGLTMGGTQASPTAGLVILSRGGDLARAGSMFSVLDARGYAGLVRITAQSDSHDDIFPSVFYAARIAGRDPVIKAGEHVVAVGPVGAPLPHASFRVLGDVASNDLSDAWRTTVQVDLDGDGNPDVESVERCAHAIATDCAGNRSCAERCIATRSTRGPPGAVMHVHCQRWVPDSSDCVPGRAR
jgi:hypothetical protein